MPLVARSSDNVVQFIVVMFMFVLVLGLAYVTTRWIAGYQKTQNITRNIYVVESIRVANNRFIQLVRAGKDTYYVIAVGKNEVSLLGTLHEEDLKESVSVDSGEAPTITGDFAKILESIKSKMPDNKSNEKN